MATRLTVAALGTVVVGAFLWLLHKKARDPFLVAAGLCFGLSMLAKGPVGVGLGGIVLVTAVALIDGPAGVVAVFRRRGVPLASAVFLVVSAPWPLVMLAYDGLDEARKTWFDRFIRYDLLGRVGAGVHGDRGGIEYYVRTLGFGMVPWIGLVAVAVVDGLNSLRERARDPQQRLLTVATVWAVGTFLFFSLTTTKFHHYALPFLVPAALLTGALLDRLADAAPRAQLVVGGWALLVAVIVVRELSTSPWEWIDLFTYHYKGYKPEYYFPVSTLDLIEIAPAVGPKGKAVTVSVFALVPAIAGAVALALPVLLAIVQWRTKKPGGLLADMLDVKGAAGRGLVVGAIVGAVVLNVVAVQGFLARSSQHWSERWLMETYHMLAKPTEPLIAFQMDWKGETFYSKNSDIQIKKDTADLRATIANPGREFVLVQTDRLPALKTAVGSSAESRITVVDRSNAKWLLVVVD